MTKQNSREPARLAIFALSGLALAWSYATSAAEATFSYRALTIETALTAAQAALQDCRASGYQVAVAVVDRGGAVQVMLRDRYAGPHTPSTAAGKAWTAVSFRTDTSELVDLSQPGNAANGIRYLPNAVILGGGLKIEAAGSILGGIGVSGAPDGAADDACARAGIAAIKEAIEF